MSTTIFSPDAVKINANAAMTALISLTSNLASDVNLVAVANKSSSFKLVMMFSDTFEANSLVLIEVNRDNVPISAKTQSGQSCPPLNLNFITTETACVQRRKLWEAFLHR